MTEIIGKGEVGAGREVHAIALPASFIQKAPRRRPLSIIRLSGKRLYCSVCNEGTAGASDSAVCGLFSVK
jgi:hypothetical protein